MVRDVTIAIASRGNPLGLWMTCESIEIECKSTKIDFGFNIFTNGEKLDPDTKQVLAQLKRAGVLDWHEHSDEPFTPQMGRQKAIENTDSKIIFCADNHILVCRNFFNRALLDFEKYGCDVLHSATRYYQEDVVCHWYKLQLGIDFWGTSETVIDNPYKLFKIAAAGHGGVFFNRKSFEELNGYYLSSSFKGYAGEELTYDIGAWMQGKSVWLDAQIEHRHWASVSRGYARHHSPDFYRNLFSCAFILANETASDYVYKMLEHFKKCSKPMMKTPLFDLMMEAKERSVNYADWLKSKRIRTFKEQLTYFNDNGIKYK